MKNFDAVISIVFDIVISTMKQFILYKNNKICESEYNYITKMFSGMNHVFDMIYRELYYSISYIISYEIETSDIVSYDDDIEDMKDKLLKELQSLSYSQVENLPSWEGFVKLIKERLTDAFDEHRELQQSNALVTDLIVGHHTSSIEDVLFNHTEEDIKKSEGYDKGVKMVLTALYPETIEEVSKVLTTEGIDLYESLKCQVSDGAYLEDCYEAEEYEDLLNEKIKAILDKYYPETAE